MRYGSSNTQAQATSSYDASEAARELLQLLSMKRTTKRRCPHCGNANPKYIQTNGEPSTSLDLTLLCVARVKPSEWSFDHVTPLPEDHDAQGLVPCGMQWDPNA